MLTNYVRGLGRRRFQHGCYLASNHEADQEIRGSKRLSLKFEKNIKGRSFDGRDIKDTLTTSEQPKKSNRVRKIDCKYRIVLASILSVTTPAGCNCGLHGPSVL